jgi:hypothetical protein
MDEGELKIKETILLTRMKYFMLKEDIKIHKCR